MRAYTLTHLSDAALLRELAALAARDRANTAALVAHIAEVDARRLYLPPAYSSMHAYCVGELRLSDDAAYKRIQAARAARQFPVLFAALADGRLHLTAVCLLAPHLTAGNVDQLIASATHRRKCEIEPWLAQRFGRADVPAVARIQALPAATTAPCAQTAAQTVPLLAPEQVGAANVAAGQVAPGQVDPGAPEAAPSLALEQVSVAAASAIMAAPSPGPERYALHLTISRQTHDKLRHAQALLSHAVPSGEVALVLDRALDALIGQLERRRFAATGKPRKQARVQSEQASDPAPARASDRASSGRSSQARPDSVPRKRTVPAPVRRAVWQRDGGQCTFVSKAGRRCMSRRLLEFDHIEPFARGGEATVAGMRLRCRAHNQYEAERTFGTEFMRARRAGARHRGPAAAPTGVPAAMLAAAAPASATPVPAASSRVAEPFTSITQDHGDRAGPRAPV